MTLSLDKCSRGLPWSALAALPRHGADATLCHVHVAALGGSADRVASHPIVGLLVNFAQLNTHGLPNSEEVN